MAEVLDLHRKDSTTVRAWAVLEAADEYGLHESDLEELQDLRNEVADNGAGSDELMQKLDDAIGHVRKLAKRKTYEDQEANVRAKRKRYAVSLDEGIAEYSKLVEEEQILQKQSTTYPGHVEDLVDDDDDDGQDEDHEEDQDHDEDDHDDDHDDYHGDDGDEDYDPDDDDDEEAEDDGKRVAKIEQELHECLRTVPIAVMKASVTDGMWACNACTFHNRKAVKRCEMCRRPRPCQVAAKKLRSKSCEEPNVPLNGKRSHPQPRSPPGGKRSNWKKPDRSYLGDSDGS